LIAGKRYDIFILQNVSWINKLKVFQNRVNDDDSRQQYNYTSETFTTFNDEMQPGPSGRLLDDDIDPLADRTFTTLSGNMRLPTTSIRGELERRNEVKVKFKQLSSKKEKNSF
jgi:hypothetical protein